MAVAGTQSVTAARARYREACKVSLRRAKESVAVRIETELAKGVNAGISAFSRLTKAKQTGLPSYMKDPDDDGS